jgi:hypothetical protein
MSFQVISVIDPNDPGNEDLYDFAYTYDRDNDQLIWHGPCDYLT